MSRRIILFDLDGTLVDSAPDVTHALNETLATFGLPPHTVAEVKPYLGHGARVFMQRAFASSGEAPEEAAVAAALQQFLDRYAACPIRDSTVYPGAREALAALRAAGDSLAICTNKPSKTAMPVLRALELDELFQAVVCSDHIERRKPHGDHVRASIERAGGGADTLAVMVGDSENDIAAAQQAGVPSIAVSFGYAVASPQALGADVVIDHFDELAGAVDGLLADGRGRAV